MGMFGKLFGGKSEPAAGKAAAGPAKVIDPVCGMEGDPKTAPAKSEYQGKTYYFGAPGCKKSFDKEPVKFLSGKGGGHGMKGHKM